MKYLLSFIRLLVGVVFVFSGFVKGVDPMGTAYKIEEYFRVFGFEWAIPLALTLSVILCASEFLVGIALIFNAHKKLTAWILLLFMAGFTILTFIDAVTNKVTDCGCFGDAVKLTNWETFWKNVVLLFLTIIIFADRNRRQRRKKFERDTVVTVLGFTGMILFSIYNHYNEPLIDFRPWKKGNRMMAEKQGRVENFLIYENINSKEQVEIPSDKFMAYYNDTVWINTHKWVKTRTYDPNEIYADGFSMLDSEGIDHAKEIISNKEPVWIVTLHNIKSVSEKGLVNLKRVYEKALKENLHFMILTNELEEDIQSFLHTHGMEDAEYYFADDKAIKTILRSNPGLILLKSAVVIDKWHYRNFPNDDKIERIQKELIAINIAELADEESIIPTWHSSPYLILLKSIAKLDSSPCSMVKSMALFENKKTREQISIPIRDIPSYYVDNAWRSEYIWIGKKPDPCAK